MNLSKYAKWEIAGIVLVGLSSLLSISISKTLDDLNQSSVLYHMNSNLGQVHCMIKELHMQTDSDKNNPDFPIALCNRSTMNFKEWGKIQKDLERVNTQKFVINWIIGVTSFMGTLTFIIAKYLESKET